MIADRIRKAREHGGYSLDTFSEKLEISKRTLQNYEKNTSEPNASTIINIAEICHISDWWLLTGKGSMEDNDYIIQNKRDANDTKGYEVDMLNIRTGAGKGVYNYEVEIIDKIMLDKKFFKTKPDLLKIKIVEVDGDSMEPTIKDGDYVVIDESKTEKSNGIYALQLDGQLLVKRLQFKLDGTVLIISDNDKYETEIYDPNNSQFPCHIIGKKLLTIQI